MIPAHLIPVPDPLQVSWGWFQILLSSTFLLHLLVMNIMLGWAIIAFCNHAFRDKIPADNQLISKKLPFTIAFTVNFGVAPLLFLQILYGHFMYTSSVLMAVFWLSIVALLILAYYATYIYNLQFSKLSGLHTLVSGIIALFLLIITFFFTNKRSSAATTPPRERPCPGGTSSDRVPMSGRNGSVIASMSAAASAVNVSTGTRSSIPDPGTSPCPFRCSG